MLTQLSHWPAFRHVVRLRVDAKEDPGEAVMDVTAALLAATVTVGALAPVDATRPTSSQAPTPTTVASSEPRPLAGGIQMTVSPATSRRPAPLVPLYVSLGLLQGFDIYTTSTALSRGVVEANPAMQAVAGKPWASTVVKAAATATSIFFIERAWKQNRKGAVILATAINVATATVVAHNTQVARRK
jgi:Domain of unknown function (DUF5658)